ncbi:MAG: DUF5810 domain-containing protein [Halobacteriaceae archaeon]
MRGFPAAPVLPVMGYACPVCEAPQVDREHLANHLAFTALLGDDDHEAWLDERVPDWEGADPEGLADAVVEHAEETDYPQVFEDTTGGDDSHDHDHDHDHDRAPARGRRGARPLDDEAERVLAEAEDMTRRMRGGDDGDDGDDESESE